MDQYEKLEGAGYVGNKFGQEKKDYGDEGVFYGKNIAPKMNFCYTIDKNGTLGDTLTFKGYHDTKRLPNNG